jgi:hypothetical protein
MPLHVAYICQSQKGSHDRHLANQIPFWSTPLWFPFYGDEAPRAEEEATAAGEAATDVVHNVKAEPAPALEPAIKREPSDYRRQH